MFLLQAKMPAFRKQNGNPVPQRPALKDSQGNNIKPDAVLIGAGSKVRLNIGFRAYGMPTGMHGVSCRLNGLQVAELVAPNMGAQFDAIEDGFTVDAEDDAAPVGGDY